MKATSTLFLIFVLAQVKAGDLFRTRGTLPTYNPYAYQNSLSYTLGEQPTPIMDAYGSYNYTRERAATSIYNGSTIANVERWPQIIEPTNDVRGDCLRFENASYDGSGFSPRRGNYNLSRDQRAALVRELIAEGERLGRPPERAGTTTMDLGGQSYDVMNDAVTLPDGTYINLTFQESFDLARAYGCRLPNLQEAQAIRRFAEEGNEGAVSVRATPRSNDSPGMNAMNDMMNDEDLQDLARRGQSQLINGHFKWYIDDGSGSFKFYGFRTPPNCYGTSRTEYCQNGGSGGHGNHHIDYSQSARFICPRGIRI